MQPTDQKRVLVLCTGNSARSQMAEALINARRGDQWQAFSAGTRPADRVNPFAVQALAELGIDASTAQPKPMQQFVGQPFDVVITVCDDARESCPLWPGQGQRLHIGFPDPAEVTGTDADKLQAFRGVRDDIIERLLPALGI